MQGFLVHLLERDFLARLDPGRGRLRAYLKTALAHYLVNLHEQESAREARRRRAAAGLRRRRGGRRGGARRSGGGLDREWALATFEGALGDLEAELRPGRGAGRSPWCASCFAWARRRRTRRWRQSTA